ncbi:MAG: coniferyl aldehyde dehydrogenase [Henriciella sp.]
MDTMTAHRPATDEHDLNAILTTQRNAFRTEPHPDASVRIARLNRLYKTIVQNKQELLDVVSVDFGNRSESETLIAEIVPLLDGIQYHKKRIRRWMKPRKRHTPMMFAPAKVTVHYQPLGVVGIISPWNFPLFLSLSPLIGALAAGNRAMLKLSELAPRTAETLKRLLAEIYDETEVAVITGDVDVAVAFTKLPFDHIVFTGSTQVGRHVMREAAENLTPVTLELGGKSPAIIHPSYSIKEAANRIAFGKGINAGQVCVSPDYILCPQDKTEAFAEAFLDEVRSAYPTLADNVDYTSIINQRQYERLQAWIEDASSKGGKLLRSHKESDASGASRKMPMTVVLNTTDEMKVLQEEIFGPILPIVGYQSIEDAYAYVKERPRPLALYYFDNDTARARHMLRETHSGGVCINDTMTHVAVDDVPFGGIGPSGMGHYHGHEGFLNFSKAKAVVRKGGFNSTAMIAPPWGNFAYRGVMQFLKWKHGL